MTNSNNLTLDDICKNCSMTIVQVTSYINEGMVDVTGDDENDWRFTERHQVYFQKLSRLEQDLRLNSAGAVLVFELMETIDKLKKQLEIMGSEL